MQICCVHEIIRRFRPTSKVSGSSAICFFGSKNDWPAGRLDERRTWSNFDCSECWVKKKFCLNMLESFLLKLKEVRWWNLLIFFCVFWGNLHLQLVLMFSAFVWSVAPLIKTRRGLCKGTISHRFCPKPNIANKKCVKFSTFELSFNSSIK